MVNAAIKIGCMYFTVMENSHRRERVKHAYGRVIYDISPPQKKFPDFQENVLKKFYIKLSQITSKPKLIC